MSTSTRHSLPVILGVLALAIVACRVPTSDVSETDGQPPQAATESKHLATAKTGATSEHRETSDSESENDETFECPVTVPPQPGFEAHNPDDATYSEHFPEPDPPPTEYPHEGLVWYGDDELWTALSVDGDHSPRKSVWWSVNFPGGIVEGEPEVWVTWTRLDSAEPVVVDNGGKATNAYTPEEGWFMIAGGDPDEPGCWEVEAAYKGATLSYIYEASN